MSLHASALVVDSRRTAIKILAVKLADKAQTHVLCVATTQYNWEGRRPKRHWHLNERAVFNDEN